MADGTGMSSVDGFTNHFRHIKFGNFATPSRLQIEIVQVACTAATSGVVHTALIRI